MTIYDRKYETMPRAQLEQLQLERLQGLLARLRRNVRRYREQLGETRVESLGELSKLPMTTPEDMAAAFPYGMFALPLRETVRLHPTIGPGGSVFCHAKTFTAIRSTTSGCFSARLFSSVGSCGMS